MRRAMCQWAQDLHFTFSFSNSRPIVTRLAKISINKNRNSFTAKYANEPLLHCAGLLAIMSSIRSIELVTSLALNTA